MGRSWRPISNPLFRFNSRTSRQAGGVGKLLGDKRLARLRTHVGLLLKDDSSVGKEARCAFDVLVGDVQGAAASGTGCVGDWVDHERKTSGEAERLVGRSVTEVRYLCE